MTTFDLFEIERKEHYCLEERRRVEPLANKEIKWGAISRVRVWEKAWDVHFIQQTIVIWDPQGKSCDSVNTLESADGEDIWNFENMFCYWRAKQRLLNPMQDPFVWRESSSRESQTRRRDGSCWCAVLRAVRIIFKMGGRLGIWAIHRAHPERLRSL